MKRIFSLLAVLCLLLFFFWMYFFCSGRICHTQKWQKTSRYYVLYLERNKRPGKAYYNEFMEEPKRKTFCSGKRGTG